MHWIEILGLVLCGIIFIPILVVALCVILYEGYRSLKKFSLRQKLREVSAYFKKVKEDPLEQLGLLILAIVVTGMACLLVGPMYRPTVPKEPLKPITATEIPNTDWFVKDKVMILENYEQLVEENRTPPDADRKMCEAQIQAWKALQSAPMFCRASKDGLQIKRVGGVITTVPWNVVREHFHHAEDRDWVPQLKAEKVKTDG